VLGPGGLFGVAAPAPLDGRSGRSAALPYRMPTTSAAMTAGTSTAVTTRIR
jgi:hypothetical protein